MNRSTQLAVFALSLTPVMVGCGRSAEQKLADTQAAIEAANQARAEASERHAQLSSDYAAAEARGDRRAAIGTAIDKAVAGLDRIEAEEAAATLEGRRAELVKGIE